MSKNTKEIRKALKEQLGYNARQVSVKSPYYSKIDFTVRDASVNVEAVKEFASQYEKIDRCPVTWEILSGGNTFVDVSVTPEVLLEWAQENLEEVTVAFTMIKYGAKSVTLSNDYSLMVGHNPNNIELIKWDGKRGESTTRSGSNVGTYYACQDSIIEVAGRIR